MLLKFVNPITNIEDTLCLEYPIVEYSKWRNYNQIGQYDIISSMINYNISEINCCRIYNSGRPMMINYSMYKIRLSDIYYWLLKLNNQIEYNNFINIIINRHIENIIFEHNNPIIEKTIKSKSKPKQNKIDWIKQESIDLFTNEPRYIYQNIVTGETINSSDPNKLKELNNKKITKIKSFSKNVDVSNMTYSFKINK